MNKPPFLFLLAFAFSACQKPDSGQTANRYNIIPQPASLTPKTGKFQISGDTKILYDADDEGLKTAAGHLATLLSKATGAAIVPAEGTGGKDAILLSLDTSVENDEGYRLAISPYEVTVKARSGTGVFYAVQTLRQLLPSEAEKEAVKNLSLPCVEIEDAPRYAYRGMHLDVGRHFFPADFIKKYIDLLAMHKFNRFHWHLTEDQGWRLEIKKYPKLQEIAACRNETLIGHFSDRPQRFDGKRYCGYYTQEEAREIVRYAAERFITVVPEIEMPGHAQAAVAAYPELGCTGEPVQTATKWGIFENVYCPNEQTFKFLEDVLTEVMDIFPSKYIHIGGDECPKTQWKESAFCQQIIKDNGLKDEHGLQSYFIQRMEKFLNSKGRSIIGWDEILEGGLAPNATVMSWRGTEGGIAAAKQLHDVIMTPTGFCYFDYYQSQDPGEPLAIGGYLPLGKVYSYEPTPAGLAPEEARHILGVQGNLWTEYIETGDKVEYMAFPRACALAEVAWSPKEARDYDGFVGRLMHHMQRLQALGVNASTAFYDVKPTVQAGGGSGVKISLSPKIEGLDIYYTLDGSEPSTTSLHYSAPFFIDKNCQLKARSFMGDKAAGRVTELPFSMHKAAGKAIQLTNPPDDRFSGNGPGSLINGVMGNSKRFGGSEWLGFEGQDFEAVIDFGGEMTFSSVSMRFFNGNGTWIYPAREVEVSVSSDGGNFTEAGKNTVATGDGAIVETQVALPNSKGRFLKVFAKRYGIIPEGAQGAGQEAWLFVDEIVVE